MSSPSALFSCVDSQAILRSPHNWSPSKTHWSFSKTSRFPMAKPYCDNIYNLPNMKSMRKTNFGLGKKTDLDFGKHPHNITPSPIKYEIPSFVDNNMSKRKGSSVHIGRQLTTPRSYIELDRIKFPGPGRYEAINRDVDGNKSPRWSMHAKVDSNLYPSTTVKIVPGSPAYNFSQQLNPEGKYSLSKYPSSGSKVWNPPSSTRFKSSTTPVPGAGTYNPVNDMSAEGKYVLSKNIGHGTRKQDNEFRRSFVEIPSKITKTPGPGTYRLPSDFGHYDELKGDRMTQSSMDIKQ